MYVLFSRQFEKGSHDFDFFNFLILLGYDLSFVVKMFCPIPQIPPNYLQEIYLLYWIAENPTTQVMLDQRNILLSLHQPVTKYQTPNVRQFFLFLLQFKKRKGNTASFSDAMITKNFSWHFLFSIWFLVTGWSNEKNK